MPHLRHSRSICTGVRESGLNRNFPEELDTQNNWVSGALWSGSGMCSPTVTVMNLCTYLKACPTSPASLLRSGVLGDCPVWQNCRGTDAGDKRACSSLTFVCISFHTLFKQASVWDPSPGSQLQLLKHVKCESCLSAGLAVAMEIVAAASLLPRWPLPWQGVFHQHPLGSWLTSESSKGWRSRAWGGL